MNGINLKFKPGWLAEEEDAEWMESLPRLPAMGDFKPVTAFPHYRKPSEWLKIEHQGSMGSCFPAGTKITMADGSLKNIEDVKFGEFVLTHKGRKMPVIDRMSRAYTGEMVSVFVKGWGKIRMTSDHVVLALRDGEEVWVEAGDLLETDRMIVSRGIERDEEYDIDVSNYLTLRGVYEDGGEIVGYGGTPVSRYMKLDDDTCWALGLYVAEGSSVYSPAGVATRAVWTIHEDEVEDFKPRLDRFAIRMGCEPVTVRDKRGSKAVNLVINSVVIADFLQNVCGRFCNHKKIPEFIMRGSDRQKLEFVRGYYHGDGSDKKYNVDRKTVSGNAVKSFQMHASTASRVLAQQLSTMLVSLGMKPGRTLTRTRSHQNHKAYQTYLYSNDTATVAGDEWIPGRSGRTVLESKSGQARKIRSIEKSPGNGVEVYDFTVAEDHSFVAQGLCVHNCQGHSLSSCVEVSYYFESGETVQLSRMYGYIKSQLIDGIRGDRGSTISAGGKVATDHGLPLEEYWPYTGNYTQRIPRQAEEKASDYKVKQAVRLDSYDEVMEFLRAGLGAINIGVRWGRGAHAVCITEEYGDGGGKVANSWGERWGSQGWFTWSRRELQEKMRDSYTRAVGITDMEKLEPREVVWTDGEGGFG